MIARIFSAALLSLTIVLPAVCLMGASGAVADTAGVRVVVPARDIARGAVITEADLSYANAAGNALMSGTVTSFDSLKGMQTRRLLHTGEVVRADDVRHPIVVEKGQTVTMTFDAPGVDLSAMGRAMSEGGIGDTVTVQNPASFRMISGVVIGAGTVRATGPISALASNNQRIAR